MNQLHGQQCQNCHGNMAAMARGIENGRIPWVQEPSCASCHTAAYAENPGTLFKLSSGHGGVMCEGCHNSTHADVPSRQPEDNANNIALQGHAGPLGDCTVCHGVIPAGAGPHGITTAGVGDEMLRGAARLRVSPDPMRSACTIAIPALGEGDGRLLVYDMQGRIVRMLQPAAGSAARVATWDGRDHSGASVRAGTYFVLWQQAGKRAASRVTVLR
jgi:predicted CXXCH cytochrome family protein